MADGAVMQRGYQLIFFFRSWAQILMKDATGLSMANEILTYGYEGLTIDVFIARLRSAGVKTVIDVRANPLSRKRGFSKNGMAAALAAAGIAYTHIPAMGCPKPVRDPYKLDGNWSAYTRGFLAHLKKQSSVLAELAEIARNSLSCLICFETDFERCHRTFVARGAAQIGDFRVKHLMDQRVIPDATSRVAA
jgi:uncharacterized protein (DUF488 family)